MAKLDGKVAIVTGGANGIGRAICEAFCSAGASTLVVDQAVDSAADVVAAIHNSGGAARSYQCDVSKSDEAKDAVNACVAHFGRIDIVVSGAAIFSPVGPLHELEESDWNQALAVNLSGAYHIAKHAIPELKRGGGGTVILIASQMAQVANAGQAVYCATKGALVQLAKGMALDYVDDNIRVNTLSPGGVATDRLAKRFGDLEQAEKIWGPKHPMGRLGRPHEIANGAVFLASDDASFMTGADLLLDGGYTAW
ncbi:MAG: SDR family oxidoreductase [Gammaproteobacteria bacterium]|nr:SDR family oxidoreductase [Gammaproteobacteria bacterium]